MNFSFLPSKIKDNIEALVKDKIPVSLARSNASLDGSPGESYVVAYQDKIFFFSRKLGDHDYFQVSGEYGKDVADIKVRKEGNNTFLDTNINGKKYSLKFSSFEEKNLMPIVENCQGKAPAIGAVSAVESNDKTAVVSTPGTVAAPVEGKISSLLEGLAAALMYLSAVDDSIAKEEDAYIRIVCNNNQALLSAALQYFKTHELDELLVALSGINREQKLCFLANLMELGMVDGVLHRSELNLIKKFCSYMELSDDEYETIKQVLLIKNQLSVLE